MAIKETFNTLIFPVSVKFYPGEQPQAGKLSGFANETEVGIEALSDAIGDIRGNTEANKLFVHDRPTNINSLARAIGPMSLLSTTRPHIKNASGDAFSVTYIIPSGVNEFQLPYPALKIISTTDNAFSYAVDNDNVATHIVAVLKALGGSWDSVFGDSGYVGSRSEVNEAGKYHIDLFGRVYTFIKTPAPQEITYITKLFPDSYPKAVPNVIPDFNEGTDLCVVTWPGGQAYSILTLPVIRTTQLFTTIGTPKECGDSGDEVPPEDWNAFLPLQLAGEMNYIQGSEIPYGFIQIWDGTERKIVAGVTKIEYDSPNSIRVYPKEILVAGSNKYRVIVSGTTIVETLAYLRERFDTHDHSERKHGKAIGHSNLSGSRIEPKDLPSAIGFDIHGSPPSIIVGNDHPQYLSRYGWKNSSDPGHQDGAILGDLFVSASTTPYNTTNYNNSSLSSRKIYLGSTSSYVSFEPPFLTLTSTNVKVQGNLTVTGTSALNRLVTAGAGVTISTVGLDVTTGGARILQGGLDLNYPTSPTGITRCGPISNVTTISGYAGGPILIQPASSQSVVLGYGTDAKFQTTPSGIVINGNINFSSGTFLNSIISPNNLVINGSGNISIISTGESHWTNTSTSKLAITAAGPMDFLGLGDVYVGVASPGSGDLYLQSHGGNIYLRVTARTALTIETSTGYVTISNNLTVSTGGLFIGANAGLNFISNNPAAALVLYTSLIGGVGLSTNGCTRLHAAYGSGQVTINNGLHLNGGLTTDGNIVRLSGGLDVETGTTTLRGGLVITTGGLEVIAGFSTIRNGLYVWGQLQRDGIDVSVVGHTHATTGISWVGTPEAWAQHTHTVR